MPSQAQINRERKAERERQRIISKAHTLAQQAAYALHTARDVRLVDPERANKALLSAPNLMAESMAELNKLGLLK